MALSAPISRALEGGLAAGQTAATHNHVAVTEAGIAKADCVKPSGIGKTVGSWIGQQAGCGYLRTVGSASLPIPVHEGLEVD